MNAALDFLKAAMDNQQIPSGQLPSHEDIKELIFALSAEDDLFEFIKALNSDPHLLNDRLNAIESNTQPSTLSERKKGA